MVEDFPRPTPGPELAQLRKQLGVEQKALADRLGMHRISIRGWERSAEVDPIRAAKYRKALHELVAEAVGGTA